MPNISHRAGHQTQPDNRDTDLPLLHIGNYKGSTDKQENISIISILAIQYTPLTCTSEQL